MFIIASYLGLVLCNDGKRDLRFILSFYNLYLIGFIVYHTIESNIKLDLWGILLTACVWLVILISFIYLLVNFKEMKFKD